MAAFSDHREATPTHLPRVAPTHDGPDGSGQVRDLAATLGNAGVGRVLHAVQRAGATTAQHLDETVARAIEDRRGQGRPLDDDTRAVMEDSLGHDFSDVRVHTDSSANDLNEAVSARAFTTGSDLFFKQGTFDPGSSSGKELLAHELTHVVQQREGTSGLGAGEVSHPTDAAEQHAESVGRLVAGGHDAAPAVGGAGPPVGVARETAEEDELQASRAPVAREAEEDELQASRDPLAREAAEEDELQASRDPVAREAEEEELQASRSPVAREAVDDVEDALA